MNARPSSPPVAVRDVLTLAVPELGLRMRELAIRQEWARTVGPDLARRSQPGELKAGTLTIIIDNSPWLHELTLRSRELLQAVRARHGASITALRFALGTLTPPADTGRRTRPEPTATLDGEEMRAVAVTAAPLTDPALNASLRRLLAKDLLARRQRVTDGGRAHPVALREDS